MRQAAKRVQLLAAASLTILSCFVFSAGCFSAEDGAELLKKISERSKSLHTGKWNAVASLTLDKLHGIKWLPLVEAFESREDGSATTYGYVLGGMIIRRYIAGKVFSVVLDSPSEKILDVLDISGSFPPKIHYTQILGPTSLLCLTNDGYDEIIKNYSIRVTPRAPLEDLLKEIPPNVLSLADPSAPQQKKVVLSSLFSNVGNLIWFELNPRVNNEVTSWFPLMSETVTFSCYLGVDPVTGDAPMALFLGSPTSIVCVRLNEIFNLEPFENKLINLSTRSRPGVVASSISGDRPTKENPALPNNSNPP